MALRYTMNSTNLKENFLKSYNGQIPREYLAGYQAHHIIPIALVRAKGQESAVFDQAWNCLMLPDSQDSIIHKGSHGDYTKYITGEVDALMQKGSTFLQAAQTAAANFITWYDQQSADFRKGGISLSMNDVGKVMK